MNINPPFLRPPKAEPPNHRSRTCNPSPPPPPERNRLARAPMSFDDKDFDDAALWALMDSAASAASLSSKPQKTCQTLTPVSYASSKTLTFPSKSQIPNPSLRSRSPHSNSYGSAYSDRGEVVQHEPQPSDYSYRTPPPPLRPPWKIARSGTIGVSESREVTPLSVTWRSGSMLSVPSPEVYASPGIKLKEEKAEEGIGIVRHSLAGKFPSVSLFKVYQNAAMEILEKSDYTMISGHPFIKKSGWRKISFYFNLSYEIRDKTIEFDEKRDVQRAEFIVRAYMQGGRFSDGWGSCERREKRFNKPNHDIPSTAETRAKNKASQDLLGIGEYRPGISHGH